MSNALIERIIPGSGERLPVIGLGTWQVFDVGAGPRARSGPAEVLQTLVSSGGRLVDSSPMYGRAESVVGDLASEHGVHERLFIATKVWTEGREAGIAQMEESMRRLQVKAVDLMQVHNLVDVHTHLETLRAWKAAGRVRYIGISHYAASHHDALCRVAETHPIDFIQVNYSVAEREAERRVLPLAMERGIAVIVNRPLAVGRLLRQVRARPVPAWATGMGCDSWAQLLLKFVASHPAVTSVIPATSRAAHMRENLLAGAAPMPDEDLRARIVTAALS